MTQSPGPGSAGELCSIAATFADLGKQVETASTERTLEAIAAMAAARLHAAAASITTLRRGRFNTAAATSDQARAADALQYQLGSGPCIDAIVDNAIYNPDDLATDQRWPEFGPRVVAEHGFASMLSYRLSFETPIDGHEMIAGLNIYGGLPGAFNDADQALGLLLSTHAAIALVAATERERSHQLREALESNREIGVAIGVLMAQYKLGREQAFDLLRIASQQTNRKLHQIAQDVADTGTLEVTKRSHPDEPAIEQLTTKVSPTPTAS